MIINRADRLNALVTHLQTTSDTFKSMSREEVKDVLAEIDHAKTINYLDWIERENRKPWIERENNDAV